jgi:CRISPR-associated protein Cmr3
MNTILLQPTDVLFFRDGRPMTGSLAGHGAAWPMPNVINAAFHAALHRSGFAEEAHSHRRGARGVYADDAQRDRKFGSLVTAGPFPVRDGNAWFFPRPQDLQDATLQPGLLPTASFDSVQSSLSDPLEYAVANRLPPSKESGAKAWLSRLAFETYLETASSTVTPDKLAEHMVDDSAFSDREHTIGIGIDPKTGSQDGKSFYSAHYLRLREAWQLGVCASAEDKEFKHEQHGKDLITALLNGGRHQIIVGGQQRVCSAKSVAGVAIPLPRGKTDGFKERNTRFLVKWILLSPAVWPSIAADAGRNINAHPGGWLPNWINPHNGDVLLKAGDVARGESESREAWRQRTRQQGNISAKLVSAIVSKPLVVTGWSLPDEGGANDSERNGGAKSTHLAVPAGAVYYFEAASAEEAAKLAAALNWHGNEANSTTIKNRRSTLMGEKGFGLGVCGTWEFFPDVGGRSTQ